MKLTGQAELAVIPNWPAMGHALGNALENALGNAQGNALGNALPYFLHTLLQPQANQLGDLQKWMIKKTQNYK